MLKAHGSEEVAKLIKQFVRAKFQLDSSRLPSLQNALQSPWLFGAHNTTITNGCEEDYCGVVRVLLTGKVKFLMADARSLFAALPEHIQKACDTNPGKKVAFEMMKKFLREDSEESIKSMSKSLKITQAVLNSNEAIYIPPGYMTTYTPQGLEGITGVQQSVFIKSKITQSRLETLNTVSPDETLGGFIDFLSINV
jgi:hypothetical protein